VGLDLYAARIEVGGDRVGTNCLVGGSADVAS
jgi:hypothetical protein